MLEFLVVLFILCFIFGSIFKISLGLLKFILGFIGAIIVITLIPIAIAIIIPILIIGLGFGLLKAIF